MKVKCIYISDFYSNFFTVNNIYELKSSIYKNNKTLYYLCCDNKTNIWIPNVFFIPLCEYRQFKISKIINDK